MQTRVVVLGTGSVTVDGAVPRESDETPLETLLSTRPDAAIVAGEGEAAFFRASVAFERGVRKVVVRKGALSELQVGELGARAAELGGELWGRGDDGRYERLRARARHEVGAPPAEAFTREALDPRPSGESIPMPLMEPPKEEQGLRCEELAFTIGLKPVLYLVVPRAALEATRARYADAELVERADHLAAAAGSGERVYGVGEEVAHVFVGRVPGAAARAAQLWADGSSRNVEALGEAMGYPACCVRAFAAMASRRVNAAFPYVTAARTRAFGDRFDPFLDVTTTRLVPFAPCSYGCPRAKVWARRLAAAAGIERRAGRVTLHLDEVRAFSFAEAREEASRLFYRAPSWASQDSPHLRRAWGAALGTAGSIEFRADGWVIESDNGRTLLAEAAGLGVVLPFAESASISDSP